MGKNNKGKRTRAEVAREKVEQDKSPLKGLFSTEKRVFQFFVLLFMALGIYLISISGRPPLGIELGEPAPHDHVARVSFRCVDKEASRAATERARRHAPAVCRLTPQRLKSSVDELISGIKQGRDAAVWDRLPADADRESLLAVMPALNENIEQLSKTLRSFEDRYLASPSFLNHHLAKEAEELKLKDGEEQETKSVSPSDVIALSPNSSGLRQVLEEGLPQLGQSEIDSLLEIVAGVVRPNLELDVEDTRRLAEEAANREPKVYKYIEKGSVILAAGTEVREQHIYELQEERQHYWQSSAGTAVRILQIVGVGVLLLIVLLTAVFCVRQRDDTVFDKNVQLLSFAVFALIFVGLARLFYVSALPVLLVPAPLLIMALCLVYGQRFGLEMAVFYGLLVGILTGGSGTDFIVITLGGMSAALLTGRVRSRSTLIEAGALAGGVQFLAVWGFGLLDWAHETQPLYTLWRGEAFWSSLAALGNGVMSGFLLSGMLPAVERLFGVTTDIRLLEWSDPNQHLLQRLLLDAPGTYHHSMLVGALAADAAGAIDANRLLARVGAYFHDIGKLDKPEYFVENLPEDKRNPHDKLSPTMSSLIITAHPKSGAEMAEQYGLPPEVRDLILQSHGSSIVKYFYNRAKEEAGESQNIKEESFRYRLPKPQTKEAAIVMLSDSVESAARSMENPSPAKIENLVHQIVLDKLLDGQLDESGLSLTEISRIKEALVRGLNAVFHKRIAYPDDEESQEQEKEEEAVPAQTED